MDARELARYEPGLWYECNIPLLLALQRPVDFGSATAGELVSIVARLRGLNPRALTKQLDAVRFLQANYAELVASGHVSGGYSQTEYLQKIHKIAPERAATLAPRVVRGEIAMSSMRAEFNAAMLNKGGSGSSGTMARHRVVTFEIACRRVIEEYIGLFSSSRPATLSDRLVMNGYAVDYAVHDGDRVFTAVQCRIGGMRSTTREAFDLVAMLAMLTRRADTSCLLVPEAAAPLADAVLSVSSEWKIERVTVGLVTEGAEPKLKIRRAN